MSQASGQRRSYVQKKAIATAVVQSLGYKNFPDFLNHQANGTLSAAAKEALKNRPFDGKTLKRRKPIGSGGCYRRRKSKKGLTRKKHARTSILKK